MKKIKNFFKNSKGEKNEFLLAGNSSNRRRANAAVNSKTKKNKINNLDKLLKIMNNLPGELKSKA